MSQFETTKLHPIQESGNEAQDILLYVYNALQAKGYDPITQLVGYIISGDPTYITSYNSARSMICRLERDEILEELVLLLPCWPHAQAVLTADFLRDPRGGVFVDAFFAAPDSSIPERQKQGWSFPHKRMRPSLFFLWMIIPFPAASSGSHTSSSPG